MVDGAHTGLSEHPLAAARLAVAVQPPLRAAHGIALPALIKCSACDARRAGVCDAMPLPELARLSASAVATTLAPGHRFIVESAPAEDFFTLVAGTVKLLKSLPDGRQHITSFAGPGDFLGLALDERYAYSAEAVDAVRLCRFPRRRLRGLIADFPIMEARLLEITRHELVLAQEQMLLLGCKTARERLASFLLQRVGPAERVGKGNSVTVQLPMTRGDIGDYLGMRVETVCRMLTRMRTERVIAIVPGSAGVTSAIVIRDMATLAHLAALG